MVWFRSFQIRDQPLSLITYHLSLVLSCPVLSWSFSCFSHRPQQAEFPPGVIPLDRKDRTASSWLSFLGLPFLAFLPSFLPPLARPRLSGAKRGSAYSRWFVSRASLVGEAVLIVCSLSDGRSLHLQSQLGHLIFFHFYRVYIARVAPIVL